MSVPFGASADRTRNRATRRSRALVGGAVGVVLVCTAACSSGGGSSVSSTAGGPAASTSSTSATASGTLAGGGVASIAERGSMGAILVDQSGATLYRHSPDGAGKTTCTGGCATTWPPLTVPSGTTSPRGRHRHHRWGTGDHHPP
jgi:predicted lipoprotein with Yx(FWY)xxD motif